MPAGLFTGLMLLFLIAPILAVIPLSFNAEPYFSYPMPGLSLQWYRDFFGNERWTGALLLSVQLAVTVTVRFDSAWHNGGTRSGTDATAHALGDPRIVAAAHDRAGDHRGCRRLHVLTAYFGLIGTFTGLVLAHTALATPFVVITVTSTLTSFDWDPATRRSGPWRLAILQHSGE